MADDQPVTDDGMVAALLRERDGYVRRGLPERVAQVDAELRRRGVEPPAGKRTPPKTETAEVDQGEAEAEPAAAVPRARRAPGKSAT